MLFIRFVLGLAIGSFINVVALRYDPAKFLFANKTIGGRSRCPHCKRILRPFELVPLLSFLFLRGRCRECKASLSWRYFLVELGMGILFILPIAMPVEFVLDPARSIALLGIWLAALSALVLMALIDIKFQIIPDEVHIILLVLAMARIFLVRPAFVAGHTSFMSRYALLFGIQSNIWINHIVGALVGAVFFALLILITRGRGMGAGDAKLALVLGFLFGWPDITLIILLAFVLGSVVGIFLIIGRRGKLKQAIPFGPFLALATLVLMLWGNQILGGYFSLFGIV